MGFHAARLRRALPLCSSLIHSNLHTPKSIPPIRSIAVTISAASNPRTVGTSPLAGLQSCRMFRSSPVSLSSRRQRYDDEEITEDTILFEGCDYNHWLITVNFPKDKEIPAEEKIATYERIAAQVFGSIEEAKKKIYACSTTVYEGFQVLCPENISKKFEDIPEVVFVLPDSYIDPVHKQYGGDKYINGEIIHMPPPVYYKKQDSPRPRHDNRGFDYRGRSDFGPPPRQQNFGPPQNIPHQQQQNFGPPQNIPHQQQQNFAHQQNVPHQQQNRNLGPPQHSPPRQQNFGPPQHSPPRQQNFGPPQHSQPHQQNFGPPQNFQNHHNFGPPQNQNFGYPPNPPQEQHIGTPQSPSFGQNSGPQRGAVPQQSYDFPQNAPPQQTYPGHVEDQKFSRVG